MISQLIILTAPPASGKTFWMETFAQKMDHPLLFISPLRALAEECKERSNGLYKIMTPEEWLVKRYRSSVVVIDEFHLFFYWGSRFRQRMWEAFYALAVEAELMIVMTATLSSEMKEEMKMFQSHFDHILWVDRGNQELKFQPLNYFKISADMMQELILTHGNDHTHTSLIFCQYRKQVSAWEKKLGEYQFTVLTCVGGEAKFFTEKLKKCPRPDFIVSTSVLSHGVNLPRLKKIFFTYEVNDINFWIQMVARGGRKGESFDVYALEKPFKLKWNFFFNFLAIQRLNLKIRWLKLNKQIEEWFLKAL